MTTLDQARAVAQRLRDYTQCSDSDVDKAASTIEALCAEVERLTKVDVEPVALTEDERKALGCFQETTDDGEGYDVPKQMMRRLAQIGVVHHASRGIYGITDFGHFVLDNTNPASTLAALRAENERLKKELENKHGLP